MCFCFIMSGSYKHIEYEWMSNISNELNNVSFSAFGEYLPKDFITYYDLSNSFHADVEK